MTFQGSLALSPADTHTTGRIGWRAGIETKKITKKEASELPKSGFYHALGTSQAQALPQYAASAGTTSEQSACLSTFPFFCRHFREERRSHPLPALTAHAIFAGSGKAAACVVCHALKLDSCALRSINLSVPPWYLLSLEVSLCLSLFPRSECPCIVGAVTLKTHPDPHGRSAPASPFAPPRPSHSCATVSGQLLSTIRSAPTILGSVSGIDPVSSRNRLLTSSLSYTHTYGAIAIHSIAQIPLAV